MTREELFAELSEAPPDPDDVVYIERRGTEFSWALTGPDLSHHMHSSGPTLPDTWIYYSGPWPVEDSDAWLAFFDDLLDEMDAMAQSAPRRGWPLRDPWRLKP
jgi:hypothetical protein